MPLKGIKSTKMSFIMIAKKLQRVSKKGRRDGHVLPLEPRLNIGLHEHQIISRDAIYHNNNQKKRNY